MISNKCLWYEWMQSSIIEENSGRSWVDIERTEHDFRFHKCHLYRHMIHLSCVGCWLLITILPLWGLLVWLLRTIISQVTLFSIPQRKHLLGVLGALVFMRVLLGAPCHGVYWPFCCWGHWLPFCCWYSGRCWFGLRFHWLGGPGCLCWKLCYGLVHGQVLLLEAYP